MVEDAKPWHKILQAQARQPLILSGVPRTLAVENNNAFSPTPPSDQRSPSCTRLVTTMTKTSALSTPARTPPIIDDFFTENGEYLMVYLPEVTDREFLAGLRYGNGCDALCQSGYALDEAEEALRDMYALAV